MSKAKMAYDLMAFTSNTTTIKCTKCQETRTEWLDEYDAVDYFFEKGWRATENHCYCPKCSKKYLKQ